MKRITVTGGRRAHREEARRRATGARIAQRWTPASKERIRSSRRLGTARLVEGLEQSEPRPGVLVSASAVGYYGARGDEPLDEQAPAGTGFLAGVCAAWEHAAAASRRRSGAYCTDPRCSRPRRLRCGAFYGEMASVGITAPSDRGAA